VKKAPLSRRTDQVTHFLMEGLLHSSILNFYLLLWPFMSHA